MREQSKLICVLLAVCILAACTGNIEQLSPVSPLQTQSAAESPLAVQSIPISAITGKPILNLPPDRNPFVSPLASPFNENGAFVTYPWQNTQGQQIPYLIDGKVVQLSDDVRISDAGPAVQGCMVAQLCPQGPYVQLFEVNNYYSVVVEIESGRIWLYPDMLEEHGDRYLQHFQFLIDVLGEDKIIDVAA